MPPSTPSQQKPQHGPTSTPFNKLHRPPSSTLPHLHRPQSTQPGRLPAKPVSDPNFHYSISRNSSSIQLKISNQYLQSNRKVVLSNQHGSETFSMMRSTDHDDTPDDFISFDYDPTAPAAAAGVVETLPMRLATTSASSSTMSSRVFGPYGTVDQPWTNTRATEKYFELMSKLGPLLRENMPAPTMIKTPSSTTFIAVSGPVEPIAIQSPLGLLDSVQSDVPEEKDDSGLSTKTVASSISQLQIDNSAVAVAPQQVDTMSVAPDETTFQPPSNARIRIKLNQKAERTRMRMRRYAWMQANAQRMQRHEHRKRVGLTSLYGALFMVMFTALAWPMQQCI